MVGGSRLGPAVLPSQHARRPRAGGRRRGSRDGYAWASFVCGSAVALQRVGGSGRPSEAGEGAGRRGGERAAGSCVRIGTHLAQAPATCRARSLQHQDCSARRSGLWPWQGEPLCSRCARPSRERRRLHAPPPNLQGCGFARGREGRTPSSPGPPQHIHTAGLAPFPQCTRLCIGNAIEARTDYFKATLTSSLAQSMNHSDGLRPGHLGFSPRVLTVYSLQRALGLARSHLIPLRWA